PSLASPAPLPSTSSLTTSLRAQLAPPVTAYMSPLSMLRSIGAPSSSGHPHPSLAPPVSPFHSLTTIERANRDRNEHAAQFSRSGHSERKKRKRGLGKKLPRLGVAADSKVEDTIATASDGTEVVNLIVLVYPPRPSSDDCHIHNLPLGLHHYVQNRDAFQAVLGSVGLEHSFDNLLLTTKVVELLEVVQASLSRFGWTFPPSPIAEPTSIFRRHERLAIQLLRFVGRGAINNNAYTPCLSPGRVESEDMTLGQLIFNTVDYGIAKHAVTSGKKFLLHTVIRSPNVSLDINLFEKGLGSDNVTRTHYCLSKRIYGIFRSDTDA
ncbi:hypothetical protein EV360DRAFT_20162, partial [Lentinula raphanica]